MAEDKIEALRRERSRLLEAWSIASSGQKNSILVRIADIDEELEKYDSKKSFPKYRKFTKQNIQLLKRA
ncbi:MAG: hypothetical protein GXY91_04965 [Clostridia bacterium]|nr:hypothetical protein [Clostridia bacterium]